MTELRVAYVGNFQPNLPTGVKPWSTETHYAASIEALGHSVLRLQENDLSMEPGVLEIADVLLYTRTWDCLPDSWARALIDPPGKCRTAAVHLDIWAGLPRAVEVEEHAMFCAQHVFTAWNDDPQWWVERGVNHHWLPPAVVDARLVGETVPGTPRTEWSRWDFAFVGSGKHHPEGNREEFVKFCRDRWGDRFVHVGNDGDLRPDSHGWKTLRGQDLNDFYASVPVVVGDSLWASRDTTYVSDRAYEAPGRGAFQMFPWVQFVVEELDSEVLNQWYYEPGDWDGMAKQAEWALDAFHEDPEAHEWRRECGSAWIAEHASYTQRAEQLLATVMA